MSYLNHTRTRVIAALMLLALPACTVTFRQKPIEPLDTDRNYDTTIQAAWSGVKQVLEAWPYQISEESFDADNNAGMIITDYWVLPDLGPDHDRLKKVAYAQGAPFIGGFCQCDYPDCGSLRNAVDFGIGSLKSHYVAMVDYEKCNGCGICAQRCQYGALKFEVTSEKANVDQFKCYGCGLCETGCPRKAISLAWRSDVPAVAEVWQ